MTPAELLSRASVLLKACARQYAHAVGHDERLRTMQALYDAAYDYVEAKGHFHDFIENLPRQGDTTTRTD